MKPTLCVPFQYGWRHQERRSKWMQSWMIPQMSFEWSSWNSWVKETYQRVEVHVQNNAVEAFQTMPLTIEFESVNGQKGDWCEDVPLQHDWELQGWRLEEKSTKVASPCRVWLPISSEWWIGGTCITFFVDVHGKVGEPVTQLGPLGWSCLGSPEGRIQSRTRTHTTGTLLTREAGPICRTGRCCELDQTLKQFWEVESYGDELHDLIVCTGE